MVLQTQTPYTVYVAVDIAVDRVLDMGRLQIALCLDIEVHLFYLALDRAIAMAWTSFIWL